MCAGERSESTRILASKLKLRSPYVVPLNMLQALIMSKVRDVADTPGADGKARRIASQLSLDRAAADVDGNPYAEKETWDLLNRDPDIDNDNAQMMTLQAFEDTLIITIKGIAAGMQNTG